MRGSACIWPSTRSLYFLTHVVGAQQSTVQEMFQPSSASGAMTGSQCNVDRFPGVPIAMALPLSKTESISGTQMSSSTYNTRCFANSAACKALPESWSLSCNTTVEYLQIIDYDPFACFWLFSSVIDLCFGDVQREDEKGDCWQHQGLAPGFIVTKSSQLSSKTRRTHGCQQMRM
jgi:hypothetical protein